MVLLHFLAVLHDLAVDVLHLLLLRNIELLVRDVRAQDLVYLRLVEVLHARLRYAEVERSEPVEALALLALLGFGLLPLLEPFDVLRAMVHYKLVVVVTCIVVVVLSEIYTFVILVICFLLGFLGQRLTGERVRLIEGESLIGLAPAETELVDDSLVFFGRFVFLRLARLLVLKSFGRSYVVF